MRLLNKHRASEEHGFSLLEMVIALALTITVMASVYMLLQKGQTSFQREPEVADMHQSARAGMQRISQDLALAGYSTPPVMAVLWNDGGGINPDEITIVYADPNVPTSRPLQCGNTGSDDDSDTNDDKKNNKGNGNNNNSGGGGGPCNTIDQSSVLNIDPDTFEPGIADPEQAYADGMVLFAIETADCNGDGEIGAIPFEVTQPPKLTNAGGSPTLNVNHNPGQGTTGLNMPGGFNGEVHPDCAIIGLFRVIQYRINPPPPTENPILERRDLSTGAVWSAVSNNIENLQVQYALGTSDIFVDEPLATPIADDPSTWITRVRVTVAGRSESRNLQGATAGVFAAEDTHMRNSFSTMLTLRNQMYSAASLTDNVDYN